MGLFAQSFSRLFVVVGCSQDWNSAPALFCCQPEVKHSLPRPLEPPTLRFLSETFLSKFSKYFVLEPDIHIWLTMDDFMSIVIKNLVYIEEREEYDG